MMATAAQALTGAAIQIGLGDPPACVRRTISGGMI